MSASYCLFDGDDPEAVETARTRWSEAKAAGAGGDLLAGPTRTALHRQGRDDDSFESGQ